MKPTMTTKTMATLIGTKELYNEQRVCINGCVYVAERRERKIMCRRASKIIQQSISNILTSIHLCICVWDFVRVSYGDAAIVTSAAAAAAVVENTQVRNNYMV